MTNPRNIALLAMTMLFSMIAYAGPVYPEDNTQAQPGERFALLVGINDYAESKDPRYHITPLKGPGNDVMLMKALLLTSRFGFKDDGKHIKILTGSKATHKAIIDEIGHQLIDNAKKYPGSTVVFYFSGHGSQAYDTQGITGTGFHQTLVAYDSRQEGGSDILDDEINAQLELLRKYTDRITLIFDSCHSGSVWKDITTMTGRSLPPNPFSKSFAARGPSTKDVGNTIKPGGGDYSVIVAATSDETAVEDEVPTKNGATFHGLLTYYLDKVVRNSTDLTYDQIARAIAVDVAATAPSQHPQAEGDINRVFLGGSGQRTQPYIHVLQVEGKRLTLDAGIADGLQTGALMAIYRADAKELSGDFDKVANARVVEVDNFASVAELSEVPKETLTIDAKAKVVTPFAPNKGMPVFIPAFSKTSEQTKQAAVRFLAKLESAIKKDALLSIVGDPRKARVVVRWQCEDPNETARVSPDDRLLQPENSVCASGYRFELVPPDQRYVLFNLHVGANEEPGKLIAAIDARAKQENLRSLVNNATSIRALTSGMSLVTIVLEKLQVTHPGAGLPSVTSKGFSADSVTPVRIGDFFRFRVTNNSDKPLYVAVVWLGSGGSIGLYTPTSTGDLILPGKSMTTVPPLKAGAPPGLETYKVLATTKSGIDFRVLEQPGIKTKNAVVSPLAWLLDQTSDTKIRDPEPQSNLDVGDWTTAQTDILIQQ